MYKVTVKNKKGESIIKLNDFNESLRDKMKPKSKEDIKNAVDNMKSDDKIIYGIDHNDLQAIKDGIEESPRKQGTLDYYLYIATEMYNFGENYPRIKNSDGLTVIKTLLEMGADVNQDEDIVFRRACLFEDLELIELLIEFGANISVFDNYFLNPKNVSEEIYEFLIKKSQNIRKLESFGLSLPIELNNNNMDNINERIDAKMDLPQDVLNFQKIFSDKGHKLFVVGGAVRDYLMGKKPHDFDMVTDTTPEKVMDVLKDYRTDLQGVHFGVVRVFTEDEPEGYEIASYRKDISKGRDNKGNNQKVEVGEHITIKDDVKRRDLTMNALFYDIRTGQIVDVVGGIKDINDKVVRAVGNPRTRFDEDRLRILRAIRFAAVTHSKLEKKTAKAIKSDSRLFNISDVDDVSRERIFLEFKKVKEKARKNDDPMMIKLFVDMLVEYGIMEQIFPVITKNKSIHPTTYLTVAIAEVLRDNDITPEFKETLKDAKIPNDFIEIISILIELYKNGVAPESAYETWKLIRNKGLRIDILQEWIDVMSITDKSVLTMLKYEPTISSKDIMDAGFTGAGIGNEIRRREAKNFNKLLNESLRNKMIPKSEEEIKVIRQKYSEFYEERKKEASDAMKDMSNNLGIKPNISESEQEIDDDSYFSAEMKYNNITYHITTKPFEYGFNVGFYDSKNIGNWEDVEYIDDCSQFINQWIDENEWKRKRYKSIKN